MAATQGSIGSQVFGVKIDPIYFNCQAVLANKATMHLQLAAGNNNLQEVIAILERGGQPKIQYEAALLCSVCDGRTEIVQALLSAGTSPNIRNCLERSVIYIAASRNYQEIMRLLLYYGADVTPTDCKKLTLNQRWCLQTMWSWTKRQQMVALRNYLLNLDDEI